VIRGKDALDLLVEEQAKRARSSMDLLRTAFEAQLEGRVTTTDEA